MRQCIEVKKRFPTLISGYDLVGQEDLGRSLNDLMPELIWFQESCTARSEIDVLSDYTLLNSSERTDHYC